MEVNVLVSPRRGSNGFPAVRIVFALVALVVAVPLLVLLAGGSLGGFAPAYRYGITTTGLVLAAVVAVARPLLSRRAGQIVFAGEHTSEDWQGYMNGAVESGQRAANELIRKPTQ